MSDNQRQKLYTVLQNLPPSARDEFSALWEHLAILSSHNRLRIANGEPPSRTGAMMIALASDDVRGALFDICAIFDLPMI